MKRLILIAILVAQGVLFAQGPNGVISGRILGIDGKPAAGVRIAAAPPNENGQVTADSLVVITMTDEKGDYRLNNVPPGRYGIIAGAVGSPTYYPGVVNGSGATILTIAPGSTTAGLDFALVKPPVVGGPPPLISPPATNQSIQSQMAAEMAQLLAKPGQMIRGRTIVEGSFVPTDLSNLNVVFMWIIGGSSSIVSPNGGGVFIVGDSLHTVAASVDTDGRFRLELKPTEYRIYVARADRQPLNYRLKSITLGSSDVLKGGIKVNGPVVDEIVITLTSIP